MTNLYIQKKELPPCGTMQPSYSHEKDYFIAFLQSRGYSYSSAPRLMRVGKCWWRCGYDKESFRWKDWDSEKSAFDTVHFHNIYEPNPEYFGYHTGKQYGI